MAIVFATNYNKTYAVCRCRHGFATAMLQAGIDPKTVAVRGGWKDVATVMKHYAHAMDDPTITDVIFDTHTTQAQSRESVKYSIRRKILK